MEKTKIDWCDSTWNPVTGCLHGCDYCYARNMARRFSYEGETLDVPAELQRVWVEDSKGSGTGNHVLRYPVDLLDGRRVPYPFGFEPTLHRYRFNDYTGKQGRNIFVCSMADLFGEWVPNEWIVEVFEACRKAPQHNYIFLTKNYIRASKFKFEKNWWIGRSYTHEEPCGNTNKNLYLCYGTPWSTEITEIANQFLSIEPLLGEITDLPYYCHEYGYRWVIIGAETGNRKDKVIPKREWIERIVRDCRFRNVPIFMKSSLSEIWGEPLIQEFPEELIQEEK